MRLGAFASQKTGSVDRALIKIPLIGESTAPAWPHANEPDAATFVIILECVEGFKLFDGPFKRCLLVKQFCTPPSVASNLPGHTLRTLSCATGYRPYSSASRT
jgi:hypothetical protein